MFKLSLTSTKASLILKNTLVESQNSVQNGSTTLKSVEKYVKKIDDKISTYENIHASICSNVRKIYDLEHLKEYYRVLQDVQDISTELLGCIHSKEEQRIVNLFLSLCGSPESSDSVRISKKKCFFLNSHVFHQCLGRLQDVDASHMKLYARRMALYWHEIIKEKLSM